MLEYRRKIVYSELIHGSDLSEKTEGVPSAFIPPEKGIGVLFQ